MEVWVMSILYFYCLWLLVSLLAYLAARITKASFIELVTGIWLLIFAVYVMQYGTMTFMEYTTVFAAFPFVLGVFMIIDGALGIIYD